MCPGKGKTSRGNETKQRVVMAIQADGFCIHRCYTKVIPSAHGAELQVFFLNHIDTDANIRTDNWKGYTHLKRNQD
ncbi:transposase [Mucilaginibacter aurantiaciroseus]|uniref:transposase n=1 Tax=Mucilaginibacter aurantiaciroseus TaxID=2949308 RepID=UPI003518B5F8